MFLSRLKEISRILETGKTFINERRSHRTQNVMNLEAASQPGGPCLTRGRGQTLVAAQEGLGELGGSLQAPEASELTGWC